MKLDLISIKTLKLLPAGFYIGLIWFMSSQEVPIYISGCDKFLHIIEYSLIGFLLAFGLDVNTENWKHSWTKIFAFGAVAGSVDEIHQYFVPGRTADFMDLFADITGCAVGLAIFIAFIHLLKMRKKFAK